MDQHSNYDRLQSLISRVAALETASCPTSMNAFPNKFNDKSMEERIDQLERNINSLVLTSDESGLKEWNECGKLFNELAPSLASVAMSTGTNSTYDDSKSNTKNNPITYRRHELLACSDDFKRDISCLQQIQGLATPLEKILSGDNETLNLSNDNLQRLDAVEKKISYIKQHACAISDRVDTLLNAYHDVVMSASEKLVLYDEELKEIESQQ